MSAIDIKDIAEDLERLFLKQIEELNALLKMSIDNIHIPAILKELYALDQTRRVVKNIAARSK